MLVYCEGCSPDVKYDKAGLRGLLAFFAIKKDSNNVHPGARRACWERDRSLRIGSWKFSIEGTLEVTVIFKLKNAPSAETRNYKRRRNMGTFIDLGNQGVWCTFDLGTCV